MLLPILTALSFMALQNPAPAVPATMKARHPVTVPGVRLAQPLSAPRPPSPQAPASNSDLPPP